MARIGKKNDIDLQNVDDLKALEKLQQTGSQIDSMASQAVQDEQDIQEKLQEKSQAEELSTFV